MLPTDLNFFPDVPTMLRALSAAAITYPDPNLEWWFRFHAPSARASYRFRHSIDPESLPKSTSIAIGHGPERRCADNSTAPTVFIAWHIDNSSTLPSDAERHLAILSAHGAEHGVSFAGVACRPKPEAIVRRRWDDPEKTRWILRFYDDAERGYVELAFGFTGTALAPLARILNDHGLTTQVDSIDDAPVILIARTTGDGSDADLDRQCDQARQAAAATGATFVGIDFEGPPLEDGWD